MVAFEADASSDDGFDAWSVLVQSDTAAVHGETVLRQTDQVELESRALDGRDDTWIRIRTVTLRGRRIRRSTPVRQVPA